MSSPAATVSHLETILPSLGSWQEDGPWESHSSVSVAQLFPPPASNKSQVTLELPGVHTGCQAVRSSKTHASTQNTLKWTVLNQCIKEVICTQVSRQAQPGTASTSRHVIMRANF